ncbi:MAG: TetR/AcrR family transcriptional regulator [Acidobacteriota bacterium]|nr:TetR/AcrR family transcriptional regulator [Acidobacteriota bacterium]
MVKFDPATTKGTETRQQIFEAALELFREQGFDATTMQQVAERAEVAKGAAYYYFPSKESIIQAYYERVQARQEEMCAPVFAEKKDLKTRLTIALVSKLDLAAEDRPVLGVVFRYTGEPDHPLSCLGEGTRAIRERSITVFTEALKAEKLPADLAMLLPVVLWALQMGLLVMLFYDTTAGQKKTRILAAGALELTLQLLKLAKLPVLKPVRTKVVGLMRGAELIG